MRRIYKHRHQPEQAWRSGSRYRRASSGCCAARSEYSTARPRCSTPAGAQKVATAPAQAVFEVAAHRPERPAAHFRQAAPQADQANAPANKTPGRGTQADSVAGDPFIRTRTDAKLNSWQNAASRKSRLPQLPRFSATATATPRRLLRHPLRRQVRGAGIQRHDSSRRWKAGRLCF